MTPEKLVRAYAREATPLNGRGNGGPEQLPSGALILALDVEERARAVVETYRALPTPARNVYGQRVMLGLLATTLLKKKLPLVQKDIEAMTEGAARAASPALGPCDYDLALLKTLERAVWLSPKTKTSLVKLAERRGDGYAVDRRIGAMCRSLAAR